MKKILLVEDVELLRTAFCKGLSVSGFEIETAGNGYEGIEKAKELSKDLGIIISDIMMPVMDGFEMLEEIQKDPDLKKVPVILLTAAGSLEQVEKGKQVGATDFFIKDNISIENLADLIKKHII